MRGTISLRNSSRSRPAIRAIGAACLLVAGAMGGAGETLPAEEALAGAASARTDAADPAPSATSGWEPIAVLPLDNLAGHPAGIARMQQELRAALKARGLTLIDQDALEAFLARHRIRWTGGVTQEDSEALLREIGARSALVTTLVAEDPASPPR